MPIKFRCPHCAQFLGISRSKAGSVTDCPTCGRSIRIPKLDGTVDPLPLPKMNSEDADLARALDQLASLAVAVPQDAIGQLPIPDRVAPVAMTEVPPAELIPARSSSGTHEEVVNGAELSVRHRAEHQTQSELDPLAELTRKPAPPISSMASQRRCSRWITLISGGVCMGLGVLVGRVSAPSSAEVAENASEQTPVDRSHTGVPHAQGSGGFPLVADRSSTALARLEGRVTYVHSSGEVRPDQGARVLVVPAHRMGTIKLPAGCFRSGAEEADFKLAQAAIRSLGGDYVVVDAQGAYVSRLLQGGRYHLLLVSHYQGRNAGTTENLAAIAALNDWLDQPRIFFGQTQSAIVEIDVDAARPVVRDHCFTAPDS